MGATNTRAPESRTDLQSRAVLAGYSPERIYSAIVLIIGAGALGQNLALNLALSGVGSMAIVDFDDFERHNATRSPFYPTRLEVAAWGWKKAPLVARRLRALSTAPVPRVLFSTDQVQALGDGPIRKADVVVSAVDNLTARAWIAERCRLLGRPMVEGGFSGPSFSFSAFGAKRANPCYRCLNSDRESSASCTHYARQAEAAAVIPAIQTTAAGVGSSMAEQVIRLLHGREDDCGFRHYGHIWPARLSTASLQRDPECPNRYHSDAPAASGVLNVRHVVTMGDLAAKVRSDTRATRILFSEPVVITEHCTRCLSLCAVRALDSAWLRAPYCVACAGPWALERSLRAPMTKSQMLLDHVDGAMAAMNVADAGLRPGGTVEIGLPDGGLGMLRIEGDGLDGLEEVTVAYDDQLALPPETGGATVP